MSESNFREIQLNTKQVVFLFMAFLVAAIAVFLLGVSVGQGVTTSGTADAAPSADSVAKVPVPSVMPPATTPKPDELKYHNELQGRGDARGNPPVTSTPAPRPSASPGPSPMSTPSAAARTAPASTSKPAPTPAKPTPTPTPAKPTPAPPAAKTPPPATGDFYVQVDSFASKDNADRQVQTLKARGITAFVVTTPTGAARYKTRVGPLDRAAAEAMQARLIKEGLKPSVIR